MSTDLHISRQRGFSLLEAIVALTVFSSVSMALFSWYNTVITGVGKAEDRLEQITFERNFGAYVGMLNLQTETSGVFVSNGIEAHWSAELVEEPRDGRTSTGALGYYRIALYDLRATLFEEGQRREMATLSSRVVGYTAVRVPTVDLL